jgi:pilus assembly protein Flp/PilA
MSACGPPFVAWMDRDRIAMSIRGYAVKNLVMRFMKDQSGATAIEYGLIAAGVSVAIITILKGVGTKLSSTFTKVQNALN